MVDDESLGGVYFLLHCLERLGWWGVFGVFFGILIIALMSFWTRISFMDSGCGLVFFLRMGLHGGVDDDRVFDRSDLIYEQTGGMGIDRRDRLVGCDTRE